MLIISQISRVYEAVRAHFENMAAARDLHAMTDHQLRDLGIERANIDQMVFEGGRTAKAKRPVAAKPQFKRPAFGFAQLS